MKIGEDERSIESQFIGICFLRVSRMSVSQRPVIGAIAFEGKGFAFAEYILEAVSECQVGSDTIIRTVCDAGISGYAMRSREGVSTELFPPSPVFGIEESLTGFIEFTLENIVVVPL